MAIYDKEILTKDQKEWFGNRMDEGVTGRVKVPTYLYDKFRKITGRENLRNDEIKTWLIENCYN